MAEPTTSIAATSLSVTTVAVFVAGPIFGPWVAVVGLALAGALWPLGAAETPTAKDAAWLLLRCTLTAIAFTGASALAIEWKFGISPNDAIGPVAFIIGALGNGWKPVFSSFSSITSAFIERMFSNWGGK